MSMPEDSITCLGIRHVEVVTWESSSGNRNEATKTIHGLLALFAPTSLARTWTTGVAASSQPMDGKSVSIILDVEGVMYEGSLSAEGLKGSNGLHNNTHEELERVVSRMIPCGTGQPTSVYDGATKSGTSGRKSDFLLALQKLVLEENDTLPLGQARLTETRISMSVKEHVTSQLCGTFVRIVWKGELHAREKQNNSEYLVMMLGESLNDSKYQEQSLREENLELRECVNEWRKTATTQERDRGSRENELLQNFLTLLNQTKSKLRKALLELKDEKKKNRTPLEEQPSKNLQHKRHAPDEASDGEAALFDSDMVEQLAAGKSFLNDLKEIDDAAIEHKAEQPTVTKRQKKMQEGDPMPNLEIPSSVFQKGAKGEISTAVATDINRDKRVNPHTGAVEIWGSQALFRDQTERDLDLQRNMEISPCKTVAKKLEVSPHEASSAGDASANGAAFREIASPWSRSNESEVDKEDDDVSEKSIELL